MLYNLIFDGEDYMRMLWDKKQIRSLVVDGNIDRRIDINGSPVKQAEFFTEPLKVSFSQRFQEKHGTKRPDLCILEGRLYLSARAYDALHDFLKSDGEFLELIDDQGQPGYLFNPLRVAEDADALDSHLSRINEWGDVENVAFHEDRVKGWNVFRTEFNGYMRLYCQKEVKDAIEDAELTGLFITTDLATPSPIPPSAVAKPN